MTDTYRALCAELADSVELLLEMRAVDTKPMVITEDRVSRARAALAQPEPVAPTDEEIEEWADASSEVPLEEMDPDIHGWRRCFTKEEFGASIRAALARWGTPANNPVPPAAIVEMVNKLHQINNPGIQPVAPTDEDLQNIFWWECDWQKKNG
jgi:hypothetical protein